MTAWQVLCVLSRSSRGIGPRMLCFDSERSTAEVHGFGVYSAQVASAVGVCTFQSTTAMFCNKMSSLPPPAPCQEHMF